MKHIVTINHNGNTFTFVNEFVSTRNGFNHVSECFINNVWASKAVCHYINRTWEKYNFQSSMLRCVSGLIDAMAGDLKTRFMNDRHYQKLTAKRRNELDTFISENPAIIEYRHIYNDLCENCY